MRAALGRNAGTALGRAVCSVLALAGCAVPEPSTDLGFTTQSVVGGHELQRAEAPWQARLRSLDGHVCGAVLIGSSWALTAAHCLRGFEPNDLELVLGDTSLSELEPEEQSRAVERFEAHSGAGRYAGLVAADDLALLELSEPVACTDAISAISRQPEPPVNPLLAVGWGATENEPSSDHLLGAWLEQAPETECTRHLAELDAGELAEQVICAGAGDGAPGICHGDSGSALVSASGRGAGLVGVAIGGGPGCNEYSLFVKVERYADWIAAFTD